MYKYKRGINNIEQAKNLEFCLSNNLNTYLSLTACLETKKPNHGLYIRNNKVMVEDIYEKIDIGSEIYDISNFSTSTKNMTSDEYICKIDLLENIFEYDVNGVSYTKKINFVENEDIMYIDYNINNNLNKKVKFTVIPLLTYRDLFVMKDANKLKFSSRPVSDGFLYNLSVVDEQNLVIKLSNAKIDNNYSYITNVKHEYIDDELVKKIYLEDLYISSKFEINLKAKEIKNFRIYIGDKDFNIEEYDNANIEKKEDRLNALVKDVKQEYVELKDFICSIDSLDMNSKLINEMPYKKTCDKDICGLIDITQSIEGAYLITGKIKEAKRLLIKINRCIEDIDIDNIDSIRLKLWYIESVNRLIQKDGKKNIDEFFEIIQKYIIDINKKIENNETEYLSYIDVISLWYNALKIYESMLNSKKIECNGTYEKAKKVQDKIIDEFWYEDKRLMRKDLKETEVYATIDMIYVLSLSYQCVSDYNVTVKLLDTIFKELYTPYGLRKISKNSPNYDFCVYPKYMAHFVKANLRQNGVTLASQKIAYNLVKELMMDINKYVNGGVKKVYSEKGININTTTYDLLTNAEMIRLYDMLI